MTEKKRLLPALAMLLAFVSPRHVVAHRLDEYLQATRIAIEMNRVVAEVNLTPGAAVADAVFKTIDRDGNGEISPEEAGAYSESLVKSLTLDVDGNAETLTLEKYTFPTLMEMRRGDGVIRVRATLTTATPAPGSHRLSFSNPHRPDISAYMVNALLPDDSNIRITGMSRDMLQREFAMDYTVSDKTGVDVAAVWPALLSVVLAGAVHLLVWRLSRSQGIGNREQIRC